MTSPSPAPEGQAPLDITQLNRIIGQALQLCGLDAVRDAMAAHLAAAADRVLPRGRVDLTELWLVLSRDPELAPRAANVLLLVTRHLEQERRVAPSASAEALAAVAEADERTLNLEPTLRQLAALVQAAAAPPPEPQASPSPEAQVPAAWTPPAAPGAGVPLGHALAIVGLGLALTAGLTVLIAELATRRDPGKIVADAAALSKVVPVELARLSPRALVVVLRERRFGERPAAEQIDLGRRLIERSGRPLLDAVYIVSGRDRYLIDTSGPGRVSAVTSPR